MQLKMLLNNVKFLGLVVSSLTVFLILSGCSVQANYIELNFESDFVYEDETLIIEANVLPMDSSDKEIEWNSEDENIASVSNGVVTGVNPGSTIISATVQNGVKESVEITVLETISDIEVESISLDSDEISLEIGESYTLYPTILPENATDKTVAFNSSDPNVATVDIAGRITAISPGKVEISVSAVNLKSDSFQVIVKEPIEQIIEVESIIIDKDSIGLEIGQSYSLSPSVLPENATDETIYFRSTDSNVATVNSSGKILAVGPGKAEIVLTVGSFSSRIRKSIMVHVRYEIGDKEGGEIEPNDTVDRANYLGDINGFTIFGSNDSSEYLTDVDIFAINVPTSDVTVNVLLYTVSSFYVDSYLMGITTSSDGEFVDDILAVSRASNDENALLLEYFVEQRGIYYIIITLNDDAWYSNGGEYYAYIWWD